MLFAKANGADINWKDSFEEGKTPLMKATAAVSRSVMTFDL